VHRVDAAGRAHLDVLGGDALGRQAAVRRATSSRKRLDSSVERPVMNWGRLPGWAFVMSMPASPASV
jgi:hypothetical protein